ncbi:MAG: thiamine-phosphate kinase [Gammaproteobacteria bacterium]|nr:thiamine-phosphate kinase [Gammaproteobacteria bacterium]
MSSPEFDLIARHFAPPGAAGRGDVVLGIGDDAALLRPPSGMELVATLDTLVAGVHFPLDTDAESIGHKALAVNLSDLAAMGAEPAWALLALTLPEADERWLADFAHGFFALARGYGVALVGGDTTRGPLSVSVQVQGFVPPGAAFRRDGARPGDLIYVTGTLGDAGLALRLREASAIGAPGARAFLRLRLDRPQPRVQEALRLRGLARSAIDVSDGLLADLGHILRASGVGATLELARLPLSPAFRACLAAVEAGGHPALRSFRPGLAWADLALASGDDYELCFTVDPAHRPRLEALAADGLPCTCIGTVDAEAGLRCRLADGTPYLPSRRGYDHFAGEGS